MSSSKSAKTPASVSHEVELLFFGDIVGKSGRKAVQAYLSMHPKPTTHTRIVVANAENATHGFGLSETHYYDLLEAGVDILTGGNHIWDRKDIVHYMANAERLLRPHNMPGNLPGSGVKQFELQGVQIGVINLIGQVYMANYNTPWEGLDEHIRALKQTCRIVFVDFHAEATAEKLGLAHYCRDLGVSAFAGTHTHVQTADNQLLGPMGYITDAGFNGDSHSVIGMSVNSSLLRMKSLVPSRMEVAEGDHVQVNAVQFWLNSTTGQCNRVERINERFNLSAHTG